MLDGKHLEQVTDCIQNTLQFQFQISWQLLDIHLTGAALTELPNDEFLSGNRTRWPFADKPFHELAAWLNLELMKNAAEIGYCRFLYASSPPQITGGQVRGSE
ncbi:MAG: hypothetical protein K0R57_6337 [Paenibacillaceae bacterium]|jgi:hypothetical protein|nr:hypothetical protein [Paenibacillaceae bacterium]